MNSISVLIVEDDPMVAKFNRHYVEQVEGFRFAGWAATAEEAEAMMEGTGADLILLDIYLPGAGGLELLARWRRHERPVDVIVISAASDNASIHRALRYGAMDYLIKPFEFARFQAALEAYRNHFAFLDGKRQLSQEELDELIRHRGEVKAAASELPKGLTDSTLCSLWGIIEAFGTEDFSTEELASRAQLSRISVRKYLAFLHEIAALEKKTSYGAVGRPVLMYRTTENGKETAEKYWK